MENKLIINEKYSKENHPTIESIQIIEGKNNFPISWLNQQGYCEYQIYLQYMKGIKTSPTNAMLKGTQVHNTLEEKFLEDATPIVEVMTNIQKMRPRFLKEAKEHIFILLMVRNFLIMVWLFAQSH